MFSAYKWSDVCSWTGMPYQESGKYEVTCPNCARMGKKHKMYLNATKRVFNCFHCGHNGGCVALYSEVFGVSEEEAKLRMKELVKGNIEAPKPPVTTLVVKEAVNEKQSEALPLEVRDRVYRDMIDCLKLSLGDRFYLRKKGLSDGQINAMRFRSLPIGPVERHQLVDNLLAKGHNLLGIPGFYEKDGQIKFVPFEHGILIPLIDVEGKLTGFQIRSTRKDCAKDKRYFALSSASKHMGTKSETYVHCFVPKNVSAVYITEGALKADVAACLSGLPVLALLGVNCTKYLKYTFSKLPNLRKVYIAFDMDKFSNENVLNAEKKLVAICIEAGLEVQIVNWNREYKGIDDYLLAQHNG